jgi:hypothetical protein
MFEVIEVEDTGVFLSVICGGIALYERIIQLTPEEISVFSDSGEEALYPLVSQICKGLHEDREFTNPNVS